MAELKRKVEPEEEQEFTMRTTDFLRSPCKQIKDSISHIKDHFVEKDRVSVVPKTSIPVFQKLKASLIDLLKKNSFLFHRNIIRGYDIKDNEHGRAFVLMTKCLGPVLDIPLQPRPNQMICDVFLAMPHQPLMVFTIMDGDICEAARTYNTHLTSSITERFHRFSDECVHLIRGVLAREDLEDESRFENKIEQCAESSSFFFNLNSFTMDLAKYERILLSFWAAVAETKSVIPKDNIEEGFLRFLTKEQCVVLVEMIDQEDVEVRCGPGAGSTTLMVEVARRLSRIGSTLLVCQTTEEKKKLSAIYEGTIAVKGSVPRNLSKFSHVIDATNTVNRKAPVRLWRFIKDSDGESMFQEEPRTQLQKARGGKKRVRESPSQCGKCFKYFKTNRGLALHSKRIHDKDDDVDEKVGKESLVDVVGVGNKVGKESLVDVVGVGNKVGKESLVDVVGVFGKESLVDVVDKDSKESWVHKDITEQPNQEDTAVNQETPDLPKGCVEITCEGCNATFSSKEKFEEHIEKENISSRKAGPHMDTPSACLVARQRREEESLTLLHCPTCQECYKSEQELEDHIKEVHTARTCTVLKDHGPHGSRTVPGFSVLFTEGGKFYQSRVESPKMTYTRVFRDLKVKNGIDLVNFEESGQQGGDQLQLLEGVVCDPIPLSQTASSIIYLETHSKFLANEGWAGIALGICEEGTLDSHRLLSKQERTWCVCVGQCQKHNRSLCTKIWEGPGKQVGECSTHTLLPKNPPKGAKSVVKLALVLNIQKGRIGFLDLDREMVLYKFDCEFKDPLYPVFSISTTKKVSRRTMTLVTGSDVAFNDVRKSLICEALSDS